MEKLIKSGKKVEAKKENKDALWDKVSYNKKLLTILHTFCEKNEGTDFLETLLGQIGEYIN